MTNVQRKKVYEIVTDRIIENLKKGIVLWHKPWNSAGLPKNLLTKKEYRGINIFLLGTQNYCSPYWLTFKQCKTLGGSVNSGAKATMIIFWDIKKRDVEKADGTTEEKKFAFLRYYNVFNTEQCKNLKVPEQKKLDFKPIEQCEKLVKGYGRIPEIKYMENAAFYNPTLDYVNMPKKESFKSVEKYYSTLFHELTHSTGYTSRLNRKGVTDCVPFGTTNYSKEELIAEMGASFMCAMAGIENKTIDNSSAYIHGWLKVLNNDPKFVISASASAQKAVDYMLGIDAKVPVKVESKQVEATKV